ncbi:hypothetical protein RSOLAG22IIIB_09489 [Rhizoctonia solani]|uniref:Uncharacterized protein n=1 Tax=Rhizoctonia solani TaxID=456999 RepID=A0A0K6FYG5_9AGAM|nr:hypothetical protein RSOLAG22IIIB_09489 [Rhizoctonia solani]
MRLNLSSLAILAIAVGYATADSTQRRWLNPHLSNVRHVDFENPVKKSCNILVKSAVKTYGYLHKSFNDFGEYGRPQFIQNADALVSPPVNGDTAFSDATRSSLNYESAIWCYDATTNQIRTQWINPDGSGIATHLVHGVDGDAELILLTGDPSAMQRDYAGDYPEVTFTCATPVSTPV